MRFFGIQFLLLQIVFFLSCGQNNTADRYNHLDYRSKIRLKQYLIEGKKLYNQHCANCHQADGTGLAQLYPPLKNSDYLLANRKESICGIRYGQNGKIIVNGIAYNQEMPANPNLTNLEIAEIATYIYNEFADTVQLISVKDLQPLLSSCDAGFN